MAGVSFSLPAQNWSTSFGSTSPTELLRPRVDYEALQRLAAERKAQLIAREQQRQQRESQLQPLKEERLRSQIEHDTAATLATGASDRFNRLKDQETMRDVVAFADHMERAPELGTPEYTKHVLQGVQKFPRIATSEWGKDTLKNLAQEHDTIANLRKNIPAGFEVGEITVGADGKNRISAKRTGDPEKLAKELHEGYGLTPGQIQSPVAVEVGRWDGKNFEPDNRGNIVRIDTGRQKETGSKIMMSTAEYERFGGKYSPETIAARGDLYRPPQAEQSIAPEQAIRPDLTYTDTNKPFTPAERAEYIKRIETHTAASLANESAASPTAPTLSAQDQQALAWAKANPDDPRSRAITKKLSVQ